MESEFTRRDRRPQEGGFTMIELLMVIVILAILASIIILAVQDMTHSSAQSACRSDFKTIETAQEAYKGQIGAPATSLSQLQTPVTLSTGTVGPWIKDLPSSPTHYAISIDLTPGSTYGDIMVASVNPAHAAADGNANCQYA